jgi:uncharacterized zinc-type alcohol dehydrogenase-like protein
VELTLPTHRTRRGGRGGRAEGIELIPIRMINEAYERMLKSDVKYCFVIDLASLT